MDTKEIDEFANTLVQNVRDLAIKSCDNLLNPNSNNPMAERWKNAGNSKNVKEILEVIIPDCIDETIFYFLQAIDKEIIKLNFETEDGLKINLADEGMGELSGWYMKTEGWRQQFSKERINDYFSDLNLEDLGL